MSDRKIYADRRESLIKAVAKRRRKVKVMAIEHKGGRCQICILLCANCHREVESGITQLPREIVVENEVNSGNSTV